jgi:hypothetical protein
MAELTVQFFMSVRRQVVATACDMETINSKVLNCWVLPKGNHSLGFRV